MTYCVGLRLNKGLVLMSDTRTNAGVDDVSSTRKMRSWAVPGERFITVLSAGNLATTQAVTSILDERSKAPEDRDPSILRAPTMFQVATLVGQTLKEVIAGHLNGGARAGAEFNGTLILAGQIRGMEPRLFLIYPAGNFIEAQDDAPFIQIGETKYGRPILVRAFDPAMSFDDAVKLLMVSFDSTIKANLSVGPPLDLQLYETDSLGADPALRIDAEDPTFRAISDGWGEALRDAFLTLPKVDLSTLTPT